VQSKLNSLKETSLQVITDIGINMCIAVPLARFLHNIESKAILDIMVIMTIINFGKTYAIRRANEKRVN
jgi:hypothetical protein